VQNSKKEAFDAGGLLTVISGIALILCGVFSRFIPVVNEQGSWTPPGMIICGIICIGTVAYPTFIKPKVAPKRKDQY